MEERRPVWMCVLCSATDLKPCEHSPMYRFAWDGRLQPICDDGMLLKIKIENDLKEGAVT